MAQRKRTTSAGGFVITDPQAVIKTKVKRRRKEPPATNIDLATDESVYKLFSRLASTAVSTRPITSDNAVTQQHKRNKCKRQRDFK